MRLYCIPRLDELEEFYEFSKKHQAAFEYNEFFVPEILDDGKKRDKIIEKYKRLPRDRSQDTLHGAFLDIAVNSEDLEIYKVSKKRVYQCMDIACELGLKAVIFHTNYITNFKLPSYRKGWVERNEVFWRQTLRDYPNLKVYMENMFDDAPDMLCASAERMEDEERFGVCLDFAHAFVSGTPIEEWVDQLAPYVRHLHINDNDGVADQHLPVGKGIFPWEQYKKELAQIPEDSSVLIEVRGIKALMESVSYMEENNLF